LVRAHRVGALLGNGGGLVGAHGNGAVGANGDALVFPDRFGAIDPDGDGLVVAYRLAAVVADSGGFVVADLLAPVVPDDMHLVVLDRDVLVLLGVDGELFLAFFVLEADLVEIRAGTLPGTARLDAALGLVGRQFIGRHRVAVIDA